MSGASIHDTKRRYVLVVILGFLGIGLLLAGLAYLTPKPSSPVFQTCPVTYDSQGNPISNSATQARCRSIQLANQDALDSYAVSLRPFQARVETAEAFFLLSIVTCFEFVGLSAPSLLKRGIKLPQIVRVTALLAALAGSLVFTVAALLDFSDFNPLWVVGQPHPVDYPQLYSFASSVANSIGLNFLVTDWTDQWTLGYGHFGLTAFSAFALAVAGAIVLRVNRGIWSAFKEGVISFVAPTLTLFELGLWYFVPAMTFARVASFASWNVVDVPLVSNWLVLIVSSGIFALGLIHKRLGFEATDPASFCSRSSTHGSSPISSRSSGSFRTALESEESYMNVGF